jgi:hypothetical protein
MRGLRHLIGKRSSGGLLAVCVAYALAVQALMASVGIGMAAGAAGPSGAIICSFAAVRAPASNGDRQNPVPRPQCPFCFVAAQSAGHFATVGEAPPDPVYTAVQLADPLSDGGGAKLFVRPFNRKAGEPRAPPAVFV